MHSHAPEPARAFDSLYSQGAVAKSLSDESAVRSRQFDCFDDNDNCEGKMPQAKLLKTIGLRSGLEAGQDCWSKLCKKCAAFLRQP